MSRNSTHWSDLRMSPSKIGALCNPNRCLRCYWTLLRMKFQKPFNFPMPGVMHGLDFHEKQLARVCLSRDGVLPEFFEKFRDATKVLDITSLSGFHQGTNLKLYGKPDLVLQDKRGLVSVVDNKTAAPKDPDHPLSASYRAQLCFYGYLLEQQPEAYEVSRVGLLYYQHQRLEDDVVYSNTEDAFIWAGFQPSMIEIDYDPETVLFPLFGLVRELIDSEDAPAGLTDCKDCGLLDAFNDCMSMQDRSSVILMDFRQRQEFEARSRFLELNNIDAVRQLQVDALPAIAQVQNPGGVLSQWFTDEL